MTLKFPAILLACLALVSCNSAQIRQLKEENEALKAENHKLALEARAYAGQIDVIYRLPRAPKVVKQPPVLFTDMLLCYGGSPNRGDMNKWDADRFAASVSWTDPKGAEHWLFDGFLAIEPRLWGRASEPVDVALACKDMGGMKMSGHKEHWQELIDFWMQPGNGFHALDEAIARAAQRIGEPPYKRKVVMNLPDAILHEYFEVLDSRTAYWGELDGRQLDFAYPADRFAACRWYIDTMNAAFEAAGFKYIELIGYYVHSEEIPTPTRGWRWPWKQLDVYLPSVADYLHTHGQYLTWIPYREAASYDRTEELGIDYTWMQPNYYWEGDRHPWDPAMKMITDNGISMEFEFDDRLAMANRAGEEQRRRFMLYIEHAKSSGLYGTRSFTYFQNADAVRNLREAPGPEAKKVCDDLCSFVAFNPLREKVVK